MLTSELKTYYRSSGDIQRVQVLKWDDWSRLDFIPMEGNERALRCFRDIYANFLVPGCPWIFGNMILFQIPKGMETDFSMESKAFGKIGDPLTAAAIALKNGVNIVGGKPFFKNKRIRDFWHQLEKENSIYIVSGKLPFTKVIPVGNYTGYLSEVQRNALMKVNASFFIMDSFDCATVYDHVGRIFGLCVKNGIITSPPLYHREAFLVYKDGTTCIRSLDIRDIELEIGGLKVKDGYNATIYTRPNIRKSPNDNCMKLVIVGNKIIAIKKQGSVPIPASGYVLSIDQELGNKFFREILPGEKVLYRGLEDVIFGIQVGNSVIKNGEKTKHFLSSFYNIRKLDKIPYPPSLYPMNYEKSRAARMVLGCDKREKPVILWAEGAGKLGYVKGKDSTGASLSELAEIAQDLELLNAVNLDGGGSAQILCENKRTLRISDRKKEDNSDAERQIPLGLIIK